jgi:hypothetical protein
MRKGLSGHINVSGSLYVSNGKWQRNEEQEKIRRRSILPGYPIEAPFENMEQIEKYFSADRITCLLCGKPYKSLPCHLKVHNYTELSYKEKYKIPTKYGLVCKDVSKKLSANAYNMFESGKWSKEIIISHTKDRANRRKNIFTSVASQAAIDQRKKNLEKGTILNKQKALTRTMCDKGHEIALISGKRRCAICDADYRRAHRGHLQRELSANTIIEVNCSFCGEKMTRSRLAGAIRKAKCEKCKFEYMKKYDEARRERRKEYVAAISKEWYQKNKDKKVASQRAKRHANKAKANPLLIAPSDLQE